MTPRQWYRENLYARVLTWMVVLAALTWFVLQATAATVTLPQVPGVYQGPGCVGHPARPPSWYTTGLKVNQIAALGYTDTNPASYEEDHLVQLSLGGDPQSPQNLWPQPWAQARRDDKIEYQLWLRACRHVGRPLTVVEGVRWEKVWKARHG